MKYAELYEYGKKMLEDAGIQEASIDARLLLEFATGADRTLLYGHPETEVEEQKKADFESFLIPGWSWFLLRSFVPAGRVRRFFRFGGFVSLCAAGRRLQTAVAIPVGFWPLQAGMFELVSLACTRLYFS